MIKNINPFRIALLSVVAFGAFIAFQGEFTPLEIPDMPEQTEKTEKIVKQASETNKIKKKAFLSELSKNLQASLINAEDSTLTPFVCDDTLYLMTGGDQFKVNRTNNPATLDLVNTHGYNSLGLNPQDGFLYGYSGGDIIRVGEDGEENIGSVSGVSGTNSGAFLANGTMVINSSSTLYHIDISGPTVIKTVSIAFGSFTDIARSPIDGYFYGFNNTSDKISRIDVHTGEVTEIGGPQTDVITQAGAAFFAADGTFYLYGTNPNTATGQQDTLFISQVTTGGVQVENVVGPVSGSDGASCVEGADAPAPGEIAVCDYTVGQEFPESRVVNQTDWDTEKNPDEGDHIGFCSVVELGIVDNTDNGEENEGGSDGANNVPVISACTFTDEQTKSGGQCTEMFPHNSDAEGIAYFECLESGEDEDHCLEEWIEDKKLIFCEDNVDCSAEVEEEPFEVEPVEQGCVKYKEEMYCPHAAEGHCVTIDDEVYCQDSIQRCMVQRVSYERTNWGATHDIIKRRNNTQNAFIKLCVYKKPNEGIFTTELRNPSETTSYTPTVGVCTQKGKRFTGPSMILKKKHCLQTYPLKGASTYYDRYENCVQQGNTKESCVLEWATGTSQGDLCEEHADCE